MMTADYMAGETYSGVHFIRAAFERAGTTDTQAVIKAVEKEPLALETPEGWKIMRWEAHSAVKDGLWGETSYNEKSGFSIPKNFESVHAEDICRSDEELRQVRSK